MKGLCFSSKNINDVSVQSYCGTDNVNYGCSMRGAWRSLQCMKDDVAIVIHGPKGCNNEFKLDYVGGVARTYCTNMNEKDVITGGLSKLKKLLFELNDVEKISLIVILTTCTSELIGEDIDGLVSKIKSKISKKCLVLHTSGISGMAQSDGHNMVISELVKNFTKDQGKIPNSVNYIGYSWPFDYRAGRDMSELEKLLNSIGITLNGVFTSNLGLDDIEKASRASLNIVRCPGSAYSTIKFMKENFDVPYLKLPIPVGIKNTTIFFESLVDYFHLGDEKKLILNEYRLFAEKKLLYFKRLLKGKKVAVAVGANRTLDLIEALLELGLDIKVISFYRLHETIGDKVTNISGKTFKRLSSLIKNENLHCDVLAYSDSKQFWEVVKRNEVDIVFDVHTNRKLIHNMGLAFSESMDVEHPYHFYYGFLSLAANLVQELNQPFYKKYKEFCL